MKNIPSPQQIKGFSLSESDTHQGRVDTVVDRFITAVKTGDFHYISTEHDGVVMFPVDVDYSKQIVFDDAIKALRAAGWDVEYRRRTCGHGWFHGISLNR